jgi:hypothetical protein
MSPSCLSTLTYSLGLSATTGKGGSKILWNEFHKILFVMSGGGCAAKVRTFVLMGMKDAGRSPCLKQFIFMY